MASHGSSNASKWFMKSKIPVEQANCLILSAVLKTCSSDYDKSLEYAGISDDSVAYVSCRGKMINKRGYPTAFWQLLHYITVQAEDREAKRVAEILSEFTSTFYFCERSGYGSVYRSNHIILSNHIIRRSSSEEP